ncbi:arginyl-tRNA ligase [Methanocaldococcus villosus KIN24-T80]|uniref:Arginine--tRNA ligase n=1 Tax=Methanocaldococcus villosus KIN24-T80 TaxID=1069083 RepID=N6VQ93_9EURY|nr:arginine--tRNA ligase [Methanocaldococcus villosus]ENN96050.1 arginyl-tRNA ligase [Methanocaldococcus villosus KIN24-T80]
MNIKEELKEAIKDLIGEDVEIVKTPNIDFGDYSTNVCFKLAKKYKKSPFEIANELVKKLENLKIKGIKDIKAVNGYINFYIDYPKLLSHLYNNTINKPLFEKKEKKIILEHTSANPNGPLHIGHLRNAVIGDSLKRILEFYGYNLETHYYVNDMGRQMALVVYGIEKFGLDESKKKDHAISEVYIKINKYLEENKDEEKKIDELMRRFEEALEKNEENEITKKFKFAVNYALEGIKETLNKLDIKHDKFVYESEYVRNGMVKEVIKKLMETGKVIKEDALYLDLSEFGIEKKMVLARANGTSLYSTRDIAYHLDKLSKCDIAIDILGADHKLTAEMVKGALKLLGSDVPEVIFYEFISLPEGSMSTRRGKFVSADEFLEEAMRIAKEECEKRGIDDINVIKTLAISAVRFYIAKFSPEKPIVFKWEDALDFEKGAVYIQYAHARCCKLLKEDGEVYEYEYTKEEKELIKLLYEFRDVIEECAKKRRVHVLANYLIELSKAFNRFYNNCPILKAEEKIRKTRLAIVKITKYVLELGLSLLGIRALEEI